MSETACAALGERHGDDLAASAPAAGRFLLLEQSGPWGRNAVAQSDLDAAVAAELLARADAAAVKVHLIRRSARRAAHPTRTCFLADTRRDGPWLERHTLSRAADVLDLDLAAFGAGRRADPAHAWAAPVYAICTHGKRDPCCARRGRPLMRAVRAARPEETWEIGHIGGHRFAATFLAFPHGLAFGRVPAARGPGVVERLEGGEIALEHLRGRAGDAWAVQATDVLARRALDLRGLDALTPEATEPDGPDAAAVWLRADGRRLRARVRRALDDGARPVSCGGEPEPVPVFALEDLAGVSRR